MDQRPSIGDRFGLQLSGPRVASSMRCEAVARLLVEELPERFPLCGAHAESEPAHTFASQPDAQPAVDEGSDAE